ncbi:hypothetical protein D9M71_714080 [compost metagenome]
MPPLSRYKGSQQDIHLLSESDRQAQRRERAKSAAGGGQECLFLGVANEEQLGVLSQRLAAMSVVVRLRAGSASERQDWWLRIAPESRGLVGETALATLSREFKDLKHKIMLCEGIASLE